MWWRVRGGRAWDAAKGGPNRAAFRDLVESGRVHGVLAFADGTPVGWCNTEPRADYVRLAHSRVLRREGAGPGTWSIGCFYVKAGWRGRGVATRLLAAAVDLAFARGAREVEGYPKPVGPGPAPAAFVWTGTPSLYRTCGFAPLPRAEGQRDIWLRRAL